MAIEPTTGNLAGPVRLTRAEKAELREVSWHRPHGWDSTPLFTVVEDIVAERIEAAMADPVHAVTRCGPCRLDLGGPHQPTDPQCRGYTPATTEEADRG